MELSTVVLIIEPEPIVAADLASIVSSMGHRVSATVGTASEALRSAANDPPDLILSETRLGDASLGTAVVLDILKHRSVPSIFVTAFPERLLTSERPEPTFLITKPFQPETLKAAITQSLSASRRPSPSPYEVEPAVAQRAIPKPIAGLPSPIDFSTDIVGQLTAVQSIDNVPDTADSQDNAHRIQIADACRALAKRMMSSVSARVHNVPPMYGEALGIYIGYLPSAKRIGNMLLADAEIRTMRAYVSKDIDGLPDVFYETLTRLLEFHISLRSFYPELSRLYREFQTGELERDLDLGDVIAIQKTVASFPELFDKSVSGALAQVDPAVSVKPQDSVVVSPQDPTGEIAPNEVKRALYIGTINRFWKAFLAMGPTSKALEGWRNAYEQLAPHVGNLLKLLRAMAGL